MGAWGTYPKDSDGALDLQGEINDAINEKLEVISQKNKDNYDYAGLIMLLLQKGFFLKYKFIEKALNCLKNELENTKNENKSGWKDAEKTIKDIEFLIVEFEKPLNEAKEMFLTTKVLYGKDISKHSKKWRLNKLQEHQILMPKNWLLRDEELNWKTHSGLLDIITSE